MRIWSIHPSYLDRAGFVAAWREALLAKHVLSGSTHGYRSHPQLSRFKSAQDPIAAINFYLQELWEESKRRNYNFDESKFERVSQPARLSVSIGQIKYERTHLLVKLMGRDPARYMEQLNAQCAPHPLFVIDESKSEPESWEKVAILSIKF